MRSRFLRLALTLALLAAPGALPGSAACCDTTAELERLSSARSLDREGAQRWLAVHLVPDDHPQVAEAARLHAYLKKADETSAEFAELLKVERGRRKEEVARLREALQNIAYGSCLSTPSNTCGVNRGARGTFTCFTCAARAALAEGSP